jgi:hypothetical protein
MEQDYLKILTDNITGQLRHSNYDRTIEVKKFAKMITTGEGQDEEVTRYRRWEEDVLKEQRIRLYNPLTKFALARPRKYWKRMGRVEGIRRKIESENETKLKELQEQFYNFMPGESLEQWQNRNLEYLGVTDPNAWILYERRDTRNTQGQITRTKVYPVIFGSENVLNFQRSYGVLDWVLFRTIEYERTYTRGSYVEKMLEDFFLYYPGGLIRAREVSEKRAPEAGEEIVEIPVYSPADFIVNPALPDTIKQVVAVGQEKTRSFYIRTIENGTNEVPADCVGVYFDEVTGQQTYVPWFDPAEDVFKDLIHEKSIADVLLTVYAYPKEWVYTKACNDRHDVLGECERGYYNGIRDEEHLCRNCKGSGKMSGFTTEQAKIELVLPEGSTADTLLDLQKLSFTQPIDITLLEWLDKKIERSEARIMAAVFDSGLVQRPTETTIKTATEVNSILEGIADVLTPFGAVDSKHFELAHRVAAQYMGIDIEVDKSYPDDLKIEMLSDMVEGFNQIKNAGVGYEAMSAQRARIFQKSFDGNPEIQAKIAARYKFKPFDDKSEQQAAMIANGLAQTDPVRVLWTYWLMIFDEIEAETQDFHMMEYRMQKQIVDRKVAEFTQRIKIEQVDANPAGQFNQA